MQIQFPEPRVLRSRSARLAGNFQSTQFLWAGGCDLLSTVSGSGAKLRAYRLPSVKCQRYPFAEDMNRAFRIVRSSFLHR